MSDFERIPAGEDDPLRRALERAGLPTDDLEAPGRAFFRLADGLGPIGYVGLEQAGEDALLRSLVVVHGRRASGHGARLVAEVERVARSDGTMRLHLLTTDAAPFFRRLGYRDAPRAEAPPAIAATAQFTSLCPSSATYLIKDFA
ncbi:arsenic resistance N-acetyltransferase ArsN2 [Allosphingosinicella deserti]|uniref:Tyrosine protein phosphatase n=1 Tax=Allosphingosinicella deserti TaxID=2116704 RepID=A0A2P7QRN2_9SPHN|nr:arsenic resistance N-acetyltransferase ArsN2 [Sphingomonas deserti]PSJ40614.1 tyrosine protein phosphatase [Sphingomonas deserti]